MSHPKIFRSEDTDRHSNLVSKWTHPFEPSEKVFNLPNEPKNPCRILQPFQSDESRCVHLDTGRLVVSSCHNYLKGKFPLDHHGRIKVWKIYHRLKKPLPNLVNPMQIICTQCTSNKRNVLLYNN